MLTMSDLKNVTRIITRIAGLICNVPGQNGRIITIYCAGQTVLAQYDGCHVVLVLCLRDKVVLISTIVTTPAANGGLRCRMHADAE